MWHCSRRPNKNEHQPRSLRCRLIIYRKKVVIMYEKLWTYMRCYAESQMDEEDYAEALEKMLKLFEQGD